MLVNKAYRYELKPNKNQLELLNKHTGCARFAWNWGLAERERLWEAGPGLLGHHLHTKLEPEAVAQAYRELWRFEGAFRELKTGLKLRPVFHWTPQRVRGHFMVCFLPLVLESALQRSLRQVGSTATLAEVLHDLDQIHAAELHLHGRHYLCRTPPVGKAYEAFKAVGLGPSRCQSQAWGPAWLVGCPSAGKLCKSRLPSWFRPRRLLLSLRPGALASPPGG
ncbi:MAG TPA: hypothetical protein DEA73_05200 [Peptococcaceae bacterium]|nr:MAG: Transposase IS4 family protein [Moorella sp. 60_41]HBT47262.1 hypothetical protein [Peptococcaceae bacterium]